MKPRVVKAKLLKEYLTPERCHIYENWGLTSAGDESVSIARARVEPGVTTRLHRLMGIQEIYIITEGLGKVEIGNLIRKVEKGDIAIVPAGVSQCVTNVGDTDLLFYCVCTPAFREDCYRDCEER